MSKTTLSGADLFYIEHHKHQTPEEVAKFLNKKVDVVKEHMVVETKSTVKINEEPKPGTVDSLMARNKRFGAVVMTPAASELSDEVRKLTPKKDARDMSNIIHRPKGDGK